jgi:HAE1 family hydrophobic/amphiphilic exporter-1
VDYTNVLRAQGVPRDQAIVDARRTRLRPILMTTLAIIFGLIPTALGVGIGGAQRSAIAVTIIGAQSLCLFLTLLLVPAAYVKLDGLESRSPTSASARGCRRCASGLAAARARKG